MSAWLAVLLVAVVVVAVAGMVPLRRYADRQWAEHVTRRVSVRILVDTTQFVAAMAAASAAFARFGRVAGDMERSIRQVGEAMNREAER